MNWLTMGVLVGYVAFLIGGPLRVFCFAAALLCMSGMVEMSMVMFSNSA